MNKVSFQHPYKVVELAAGKVQSNAPAGKRQAIGDFVFSGQPANNDTFTLNGVVFTAKTAGAVANQFNIGVSETASIDALVASIEAAEVIELAAIAAYNALPQSAPTSPPAPYAGPAALLSPVTCSNVGGTKLHVVADAYGSVGNAVTLAEVSATATVSGATLTGGLDADNFIQYQSYGLDAETKALSTAAGTTVTEWDLPAGEEGQETTYYLAALGAGSNAQINGAFAGGLTKLTFTAVDQFASLKFLGSSWKVRSSTGALS